MKRRLIYIALITVLAVSCQDKKQPEAENQNVAEAQEQSVFPVKTQKIIYSEIEQSEEFTANINAWEVNHIGPAMPNQIEKIFVEVGDKVKKGELLAQMDQSSLIQAKLQYEDAKLDYQRMDTLNSFGSIARQSYDKTKMAFELTETALKTMEKNVNIVAPFNGIITGKYYNDGEIYSGMAVNPATGGVASIVTLMQINQLKVYINISEKYWTSVKIGMKTKLSCDIYPDEEFAGTIYKIYPTIDPNTKTFKIEIKVPNASEKLRPGMFAKLSLNFETTESFIIPANTVLKQQGTNQRFVFIESDGIARKSVVVIGKRFNDMFEIISGLTENDNLIIAGQAKLMDQSRVKVVVD
ncbi:efflux RND transporter periplasmic adaptor subunit [Bacteroidota bacterium]